MSESVQVVLINAAMELLSAPCSKELSGAAEGFLLRQLREGSPAKKKCEAAQITDPIDVFEGRTFGQVVYDALYFDVCEIPRWEEVPEHWKIKWNEAAMWVIHEWTRKQETAAHAEKQQ